MGAVTEESADSAGAISTEVGRARKVWVWLSGPALLLLFAASVFMTAYLVATWPSGSSSTASELTAQSWGRALTVLADIGRPGLDDFYGSAAIVATFIVAATAAVGFGAAEKRLHPATWLAMLASLVLGALLVIGIAVMAIPVAVVDPTQTPKVVVVLVLAWMTQLMVHGVERFIDRRQRAEQRLRKGAERASSYGIAERSGEIRSPWVGTILLIIVPLLVWLALVLLTLWVSRIDTVWWSSVFGIAAAAYYPNLLLSLVWRGTADLSAHHAYVVTARTIGLVLAGAATVVLVIAFLLAGPLAPFGVALGGFTLFHALVLFVRTYPPFRPLAHLAAQVTQRSLLQLRREQKRAEEEGEAQEEQEQQEEQREEESVRARAEVPASSCPPSRSSAPRAKVES